MICRTTLAICIVISLKPERLAQGPNGNVGRASQIPRSIGQTMPYTDRPLQST
jgi:hypothetical protein